MSEPDVGRVADLHLRGADRLLPARVYWPGHGATAPALAICLGSPTDAAQICRGGYILLAVDAPIEEVPRIVEWAAVHGPELGASRHLVAAGPDAIDIVRRTREADWPPIELPPPSSQIQTQPTMRRAAMNITTAAECVATS